MATLNKKQVTLLNDYILGKDGYKLYLRIAEVTVDYLEISKLSLKEIIAGGLTFSTIAISTDSIFLFKQETKVPLQLMDGETNLACIHGIMFLSLSPKDFYPGCLCFLIRHNQFGILKQAEKTHDCKYEVVTAPKILSSGSITHLLSQDEFMALRTLD